MSYSTKVPLIDIDIFLARIQKDHHYFLHRANE